MQHASLLARSGNPKKILGSIEMLEHLPVPPELECDARFLQGEFLFGQGMFADQFAVRMHYQFIVQVNQFDSDQV